MRVRQLFGSRAGDIVEMPYAIAQRAIASGTVESLDPADSSGAIRPATTATAARAPVVESSPRASRRGRR